MTIGAKERDFREDLPRTILTLNEIARFDGSDLFAAERNLSLYTLGCLKTAIEDALIVVDTLIDLQRAGDQAFSRQLALKAKGNRERKLFHHRCIEAEVRRTP